MATTILRITVVVVSAALIMGCIDDRVRARAANELGCPAREVTVASLGSGGYIAGGCGQAMHLSCDNHRGGAFCVTDGPPQDIPEAAPGYDPGASLRPRVPRERAALRDSLDAAAKDAGELCADIAGPRGWGEATVTVELDGRVASVLLEPPFGGTPVGDCVVSILRRRRLPRVSGETVVMKEDFSVVAR